MQLSEEEAEKLMADAEAEEERHDAKERPDAEVAHLAAPEERQLAEEEAEKLVADAEAEEKILSELAVQLTMEADAGHVAQKTADCTLDEHEPLPARNCQESCLQSRHLQMRSKKKSSSAQKNVRKVKFQKAGFVDMGRCAFRSGGGVLVTSATGGGRTCVPDALCVLIPSFGISIPVEELHSIMPADAKEDTLFTTANGFVKNYGLTLLHATAQFTNLKGGPALGLLQVTDRFFVVQLRITNGNHDKKPDFHRYSKVKIINEEDCNDKDKARKVIDSFFDKLKVQV